MNPNRNRLVVLLVLGFAICIVSWLLYTDVKNSEHEYDVADYKLKNHSQSTVPRLTKIIHIKEIYDNGSILAIYNKKKVILKLSGILVKNPIPAKDLAYIKSKITRQRAILLSNSIESDNFIPDTIEGFIWVNGKNINWNYVRYGLGECDTKTSAQYTNDLLEAQKIAEKEKLGIWR